VAVIPARALAVAPPARVPEAATPAADAEPESSTGGGTSKFRLWMALAAILTAGLLIAAGKTARRRNAAPSARATLKAARGQLAASLRRRDPAGTRAAVLAWGRALLRDRKLSSLGAVAAALRGSDLRVELGRLDRAIYGGGQDWDPISLGLAIERAALADTRGARRAALPMLYPGDANPLDADEGCANRRRFGPILLLAAAVAAIATWQVIERAPGRAVSVEEYEDVIARQQLLVLAFLRAFEATQEQVHPDTVPQQQQELAAAFDAVFPLLRDELDAIAPPAQSEGFDAAWRGAVAQLEDAHRKFRDATREDFVAAFFRSRRAFTEAVYALYAIRARLPVLQEYWLLPEASLRRGELERPAGSAAPVGVLHRAASGGRAAYSLYVPENYDPRRRWPLLISLHGSHGNGASSLLTWLRAAKSRGYLVLAPKSLHETWSLEQPEVDARSILAMLAEVTGEYVVDPARVFASGLSDGASFSYVLGDACPRLLAGIAPIAGVLLPTLELGASTDLPVLIVHGGRDFVFPVQGARDARARLIENGFTNVTYRELPEWGHSFPYSVNDTVVLPWLEKLPSRASAQGTCR